MVWFRVKCLKQGIKNRNSVVNRVGKSTIFVLNRVRVWGAAPHLPTQGYIESPLPPPGLALTKFPPPPPQLQRGKSNKYVFILPVFSCMHRFTCVLLRMVFRRISRQKSWKLNVNPILYSFHAWQKFVLPSRMTAPLKFGKAWQNLVTVRSFITQWCQLFSQNKQNCPVRTGPIVPIF